jgi:hypothetical protein
VILDASKQPNVYIIEPIFILFGVVVEALQSIQHRPRFSSDSVSSFDHQVYNSDLSYTNVFV